jgi:hypothetical protein
VNKLVGFGIVVLLSPFGRLRAGSTKVPKVQGFLKMAENRLLL